MVWSSVAGEEKQAPDRCAATVGVASYSSCCGCCLLFQLLTLLPDAPALGPAPQEPSLPNLKHSPNIPYPFNLLAPGFLLGEMDRPPIPVPGHKWDSPPSFLPLLSATSGLVPESAMVPLFQPPGSDLVPCPPSTQPQAEFFFSFAVGSQYSTVSLAGKFPVRLGLRPRTQDNSTVYTCLPLSTAPSPSPELPPCLTCI